MRIVLPTVSLSFFGQIFEILILIYLCDNDGISTNSNTIKCPNSTMYYILFVLSSIAILFLLIISYISISMYFKPSFMVDKSSSLQKIDSYPNKIFFFNKIIFIVLTNIIYKNQIYTWFILIILCLSSYVNMLGFTQYNNYQNKLLLELNKFFSILLFGIIDTLIIGKIFNELGFNGTLYLFIFIIIMSITSAFLYQERLNSFPSINFNELKSGCERLKYIKRFLDLVKTKHLTREKTLLFDTLIKIKEENCINKNCNLKKYLKYLEKGESNDFILFQHCQYLYELAIKKFPDDYNLKINYIVYLVIQMSKKKLAERVLYTMKYKLFQFENNFLIYCCQKFIKSYKISSDNIFEEENKNVVKKVEYDKLYEEFKNDLTKASTLYYDFWNTLNKFHIQGIEDFDKLKQIGKKISVLNTNIETKFNILHNIKGDDGNLLYLYSGFNKYILDNKIKYEKIKNISVSISNVYKIKDFEIDYTNFDFKFFEETDEYKYIIISAEENNLGTIINISHNASKIFGYIRHELIGRKFSCLVPNLYHNEFENYLYKLTNQLKIKFYNSLTNKKEYLPESIELFISGKDKSKYLIPLYIKMILVQTEDNEHAYIIKISYFDDINLNKINNIFKLGNIFDINKNKEEKMYKYCIVLTDKNFIIQTFTVNCLEQLGLSTHSMNTNIDLTLFIPEFDEDVDNLIRNERKKNENNDDIKEKNIENKFRNYHSSEIKSKIDNIKLDSFMNNKILYKRYIAEKNYSESKLITWKVDSLKKYLENNKSSISKPDTTIINTQVKNFYAIIENEQNSNEKLFLLIIKKTEFNNKHIGYTFFFRREYVKCIEKNNIEIIKSDINNNQNNKLNKSIKSNFLSLKSSDKIKVNNNIENNNDIKYSKTQKKLIAKVPKSLDIKKGENIVGIIQGKIKNILKEDSNLKKTPIKKCSFKNISSELSIFKTNDNEDDSSDIFSTKELNSKLNTYIPKSKFNFLLDINLMSFKPSNIISKTDNFIESLKKEAQKKIKLKNINKNPKTIKDSSEYDSSEEENETDEDNENSDSKENIYTLNSKNLNEKKKKEGNMIENIDKEYYRVSGLNKIKLMIFDFEQEMIVEIGDKKENKSEIENILINYKLKLPIVMDKDGNDPSLKIKKLLLKYSKNDQPTGKIMRVDSISENQNALQLKKKKETYKIIESELNKKEREKSIIIYSIFCFFANLVLIGMGGFSLYFILSELSNFRGNINLILYSSIIRHYTYLGIYHTRMYTLAKVNSSGMIHQNEEIIKNRAKYLENLNNQIGNDFFNGSKVLEEMIAINYKLSKNNEIKLYNKISQNIIMDDEFNPKNVSSSYMIGISQIYSHFYYMLANIDKLKYNSAGALNFVYNALNNVGIALNEIINVFLDEIKYKKSNHIKLFYIIISLYLILLIIIYIIIRINYKNIITRRDTYTSAFFQINLSFIKDSILNCEIFLNRLNRNELISNKDKNKGVNDISITSFDNPDNNLSINDQSKKVQKNVNKSNNSFRLKKNILKKKKNINLIIIFILFLLIVYIYLLIPLIVFNKNISMFEFMGLYMYNMLHFHTNTIKIYNSFNEYLFYEESTVENIPVLDYINNTMNDICDTFSEEISFLYTVAENIPGLNERLLKVQKEKLCNLNDFCDNYIDTATSLGYYNFVYFFINEIRTKIDYAKILSEKMKDKLWGNDVEKRMIILFNNLHYDIDYMFNHVILYYVQDELNITSEKFFENINSKNDFYIIIYSIYFVCIILFYLFYWNRSINEAQDQIYKAKLALNIIPVEILESQTNIKDLLGMSDINE